MIDGDATALDDDDEAAACAWNGGTVRNGENVCANRNEVGDDRPDDGPDIGEISNTASEPGAETVERGEEEMLGTNAGAGGEADAEAAAAAAAVEDEATC